MSEKFSSGAINPKQTKQLGGCGGRAFAWHAGYRGSNKGCDSPKSLKRVSIAPVPKSMSVTGPRR